MFEVKHDTNPSTTAASKYVLCISTNSLKTLSWSKHSARSSVFDTTTLLMLKMLVYSVKTDFVHLAEVSFMKSTVKKTSLQHFVKDCKEP